jgi:hypothetical protein
MSNITQQDSQFGIHEMEQNKTYRKYNLGIQGKRTEVLNTQSHILSTWQLQFICSKHQRRAGVFCRLEAIVTKTIIRNQYLEQHK